MSEAVARAVFVTLPLAGCAELFPATVPEPFVPEHLEAVEERSIARVDSHAGSLARARTLAIDLPAALELAGARSPEVELARLAVEQERSVRLATRLAFLPSLNPIFRAFAHQGRAQPQNGTIVDVTRTNFEAQLFAVVLISPASNLLEEITSARRQHAGEETEKAVRLEVVRDAALAYLELVRAHALVAIAQDAVREAEELVRTATTREALGAAIMTDVLRARASLADRQQDLSIAVGRIAVASARLVQVLQLDPDVELVPVDMEPVPIRMFREGISLDALVDVALATRPEMAAARFELSARTNMVRSVEYGRLFPFVGGFIQTGDFGQSLPRMRFSQDVFGLVGFQIGPGGAFDIPEIERRRLAVREQDVLIAELRARIAREVADARSAAETADERIRAARDGLDSAHESLRLTRDRLDKGVAIELELLDAERMDALARAQLVAAVTDFDEAEYALLRAVGEVPE